MFLFQDINFPSLYVVKKIIKKKKKKIIVLLKKVFENTENTNTKRFEKFSLNK